jgi:Subtilase family
MSVCGISSNLALHPPFLFVFLPLNSPGTDIVSAWMGSNTTIRHTLSGTSMASPLVAGVVALYLEVEPNLTPAQVRVKLLADGISGVVQQQKDDGSPNLLLSTAAFSPSFPVGGNAMLPNPTPFPTLTPVPSQSPMPSAQPSLFPSKSPHKQACMIALSKCNTSNSDQCCSRRCRYGFCSLL